MHIIYISSNLYTNNKHKYNIGMVFNGESRESGAINGLLFATIGLIFSTLVLAGLSIWLYINYNEQKTDVDSKVDSAVATAVKKQADTDENNFFEREKEPNRQFVGPDDFGRVTFDYPKTWSVYVDKDGSRGSSYQAYLNPVTVPQVGDSQQFALRVTIESKDFGNVLSSYKELVNKGDLKSTSVTIGSASGNRLEGNFSKDIRGIAVIFKLRDKTVTIRTDAYTFQNDFDKLVQTIKFNK